MEKKNTPFASLFPFPSPALFVNPVPAHRSSHPLAQLSKFPVGKLRHKPTSVRQWLHATCVTQGWLCLVS